MKSSAHGYNPALLICHSVFRITAPGDPYLTTTKIAGAMLTPAQYNPRRRRQPPIMCDLLGASAQRSQPQATSDHQQSSAQQHDRRTASIWQNRDGVVVGYLIRVIVVLDCANVVSIVVVLDRASALTSGCTAVHIVSIVCHSIRGTIVGHAVVVIHAAGHAIVSAHVITSSRATLIHGNVV